VLVLDNMFDVLLVVVLVLSTKGGPGLGGGGAALSNQPTRPSQVLLCVVPATFFLYDLYVGICSPKMGNWGDNFNLVVLRR
jgi:hypothetical protein